MILKYFITVYFIIKCYPNSLHIDIDLLSCVFFFGFGFVLFCFSQVVEHAIAVFTALSLLFPSGSAAPKKLVPISEALFHVLTVSLTSVVIT